MRFSRKSNWTIDSAATRAALFVIGALSVLEITGAYAQAPARAEVPYKIARPIPGGDADGLWDYATIDNDARRLYLAQAGVTVLDLDSAMVTSHFVKGRAFQGL